MYYFRFEIPKGIGYSPDWFGSMPLCPRNVEVLLYNDKEGYGIAKADDAFVPPEVKVITQAEAEKMLGEAKEEDGIYFGKSLYDKWVEKPELALIEDKEQAEPEAGKVYTPIGTRKAVFCLKCHQFIMWLPAGIKAASITLTCPIGHKVVLNGN